MSQPNSTKTHGDRRLAVSASLLHHHQGRDLWLLRFYLSADEGKQFRTKTIALLAMSGLIALWGGATDHFSSFGLDPFTLLSAGLPTVCTGHLFVLAFMRARRKKPNNALQAKCEDARA